jgi:hypothetical protein
MVIGILLNTTIKEKRLGLKSLMDYWSTKEYNDKGELVRIEDSTGYKWGQGIKNE